MVYSLFTCARNWTDKGVYTILIFFLPRSGFVQQGNRFDFGKTDQGNDQPDDQRKEHGDDRYVEGHPQPFGDPDPIGIEYFEMELILQNNLPKIKVSAREYHCTSTFPPVPPNGFERYRKTALFACRNA